MKSLERKEPIKCEYAFSGQCRWRFDMESTKMTQPPPEDQFTFNWNPRIDEGMSRPTQMGDIRKVEAESGKKVRGTT